MTKAENEKPQQKNYVISEEQRNTLLQYLANRPFIEVQKLINLLAGLTEINDNISPNFIHLQLSNTTKYEEMKCVHFKNEQLVSKRVNTKNVRVHPKNEELENNNA